MEDTGSTVAKATTAHHLPQSLINHRKLAATIFPPSEVDGDDRDEMLHCAASQGMLSLVLALLRAATDERYACDLPDRFGRTPLHWAAEQGRCNVVLALLGARACFNPLSKRKATPIMLAALEGHVEVVRLLSRYYRGGKSKCGPLSRHRRDIRRSGSTALHYAAAGGHVSVVKILLGAGFDRGILDAVGLTPAEVSARQSHSTSAATTHLLLPRSDMGGKLVHDYAHKIVEDVAMVSGLVKGGAFLDWQDGNGETSLFRAVHVHHGAISRVLLRAGADPNLSDRLGVSPLHVAAFNGRVDVAAALLEAGADLEPLSASGYCPLHQAVVSNRANVVRFLLNAGASTEHRDTIHGQTPLSWACRACFGPIVRVLVAAGAVIEARCSAGLTPLHWACRFVDADSVEALLNAGADPGAVDQAAATDAVEMSSSRRGTIVSMPVAIDVIDLGYPLDHVEKSRHPFTGGSQMLAARRVDVVDLISARRIKQALQDAKEEYPWRRRGWLVMLANRRVAMDLSVVKDKWWAGCCGGSRPLLPDRVSATANNDNTSAPRHVQGELAGTQYHVSKRWRTVDKAMGIARATSLQQDNTRDEVQGQENMEVVLFPKLVGALLELAAAEVGVFRRVVKFI